MPTFERTAALAGLFFAASGAMVVSQSAEIGSVAAVNRDMLGTPPGADPRDLLIGQKIVHDERIETSDVGTGQLMFIDQTTLTVAPRSDIVLDRYVFDPDADTGEIAITLTRGTLRFIGGRISKKTDAIVRTPTATIGIRGGLTLISVNARGFTRVVQLAGEYTEVTGPAGTTVTLSRPNASAQVGESGEAEFTGLAQADEIADQFGAMEGGGDGGSEAGNDETTVDGGTDSVAQRNSGVQGGADRQPVSTAGEQEAPPPPRSEEAATDGSRQAVIETSSEPAPLPPAAPPPQPPVTGALPRGGAMFLPSHGFIPFEDVARGSLIGIGPQGEAARLPIPETAAALSPTIFGTTAPDFFALTRSETAGFAEFGPADGAEVAGVGAVFGVGFSDLENGFHFYQIRSADDGPFDAPDRAPFPPDSPPSETLPPPPPPDQFPIDQTGLVVFGTPSPSQAAVFPGDTGQIDRTANTVTTYRIEPDLQSFGFDDPGLDRPPPALLMIGNGGESRFNTTSATLPPGRGGRMLVAEMRVETDPSGEQFSDLSVFAAPIETNGAGSPVVGAGVFSSFSDEFNKSFGVSNIGTFEDADGNTVFGPGDDYIVVSSLLRRGGTGPLTFDPGFERIIGGPDFQVEPFSSLLTHDPDAGEVINSPLGLANDPSSRIGSPGSFDAVFATGVATCSTGDCGINRLNGSPNGVYALTSVLFEFGGASAFEFQESSNGNDTNSFAVKFDLANFDGDSNLVEGSQGPPPGGTIPPIDPPLGGTEPPVGPPPDGPPPGSSPGIGSPSDGFIFEFTNPENSFSAYASDEAFAAFFQTDGFIAGQPEPANFAIASAGLAGDGGILPASVDDAPKFLRWGWWSASFETFDGVAGTERDDLVHLGSWVAGVQPDPADLPTTGVISYAGLAAGTDVNLTDGTTRVVGGNFSLTYDFGASSGDFNLNIAGMNFQNVAVNGSSAGPSAAYSGAAFVGGRDLLIDGAFVSGAGNAAAATVGQFDIDDSAANRKVVGVFGGDAQ